MEFFRTVVLVSGFIAQTPGSPAKSNSIDLLDASLSQWEVFIGVPHASIKGLPTGTFQSDDVTKSTPLGLNNDPKKVFSTFTENGAAILHVSGEIFGGISTKREYANYHLSMDFKWGDQTPFSHPPTLS